MATTEEMLNSEIHCWQVGTFLITTAAEMIRTKQGREELCSGVRWMKECWFQKELILMKKSRERFSVSVCRRTNMFGHFENREYCWLDCLSSGCKERELHQMHLKSIIIFVDQQWTKRMRKASKKGIKFF